MDPRSSQQALSCELRSWNDLSQEDRNAWETFRRNSSHLKHPFFGLPWFDSVNANRPDLEIAILRDSNNIVGFLPFHRLTSGRALPGGLHFSDYQGIIGKENLRLDGTWLLRACRLQVIDFDHAIPSAIPWDTQQWQQTESPVIDLGGGFEALSLKLHARGSSWSTLERKIRRLERTAGAWRYERECKDHALLDLLIQWKRQQYRKTAVRDVLANDWERNLLHTILKIGQQSENFRAMLSAVWINEEPAALHLGLVENGIWHYWFPAYSESWGKHSPGLILLREMVQDGCSSQFSTFDFGKGGSRYKDEWSTSVVPLAEGALIRNGPEAVMRSFKTAVRTSARRIGLGNLKRRIKKYLLKTKASPDPSETSNNEAPR